LHPTLTASLPSRTSSQSFVNDHFWGDEFLPSTRGSGPTAQ